MNEKKNQTDELAVVQHPDYRTEIVELLKGTFTPKIIGEKLLAYHENDVAAAMELMSKEERKKLYAVLDVMTLARILEYAEHINEYIDELGIRKRIEVLSSIETSLAADYLKQSDKAARQTILDLMDDEIKAEIKMLSSFDEDEIGSRMTTNFIAIRAGSSVKEAMHALIEQAADNDNIATVYVVDEDDALLGAIDLKDLITAREGTDLSSITMTSYPYVYATELIEDCIARIKEYSEDSIPVLDSENKLSGVLISQDMTELVSDVMGEDYARLAGLSAEEDLAEPLQKSVGKRLPWLIVLLGLGLIVSSVVGAFEHVIAHLALIVSFQSLILDMAGNVGTQSLAVTIRVLMDEKLTAKEKLFLVGKEARVGLVNGLILGVLSFAFIGGYIVLFKGQPMAYGFSVSMCTGLALTLAVLLSSVTGTVIPLAFKKLKVDPAVASGPLITTVNDLVAVVAYYGLAWLLLINMLGL